ncbi:MAG: sterol desaturase family protein, partial [Pseudomonadota bacterium]|nr:sterol desaturase family protein [Pseudomonadota bacterium]
MSAVLWRGSVFLLLLVVLALAEWRWPRHQSDPHRLHRWPANLGFGIAGALCLRLLMPWLAIDAAVWARQNHV